MSHKGLTLIEVLVVLTILSILTLTLYTVFKSSVDAWSKSEAHLDIIQNARVVLDQISRELLGAFVGGGATFTGTDGGDDSGDTLEFVTNFADSIYKIKYSLSENDLMREYEEFYNPTITGIVKFASKVSDIDFYYWDGVWTDNGTWPNPDKLPEAVKIEIKFKDQAGKIYPFKTVMYLPGSEE